MASGNATVATSANSDTDQMDGGFRPYGRLFLQAMQRARVIWPRNTAAAIADLTGYTPRNAERVLAGQRGMNAEAAFRLALASGDEGVQILEAYIAGLEPRERDQAWTSLRKAVRRAELRERLQQQREELDRLEMKVVQQSKSRR